MSCHTSERKGCGHHGGGHHGHDHGGHCHGHHNDQGSHGHGHHDGRHGHGHGHDHGGHGGQCHGHHSGHDHGSHGGHDYGHGRGHCDHGSHGHDHGGHINHCHGQGSHNKPNSQGNGGGGMVPSDNLSTNGPFPEVIGLTPEEATTIVKQKKPNAVVDVIPGGEIRPTLANIANTVRLWLDRAGKVQIVELPAVAAT